MPEPQPIDRRQFARQLTAASGSAAMILSAAANATGAEQGENKPKADAPKAEPAPPKRPTQELLLLNLVLERYPNEHFDEAVLKEMLSDIRGDMARGRILSAVALKNSDEPCSIFRAYRKAE